MSAGLRVNGRRHQPENASDADVKFGGVWQHFKRVQVLTGAS
jgi:hypothetical protein